MLGATHMRAAPAPDNAKRFQRLVTYAWLWLLAWAVILCADDGSRWRARARRGVRNLILLRAAALIGVRPRPRHRHAPPPGFSRADVIPCGRILRAAFGAELRRRLRARGAGQALAAVFRALQDIEQLARAIAKRLPRGLTRLRPIRLAHAFADAFTSAQRAPAPAHDSS